MIHYIIYYTEDDVPKSSSEFELLPALARCEQLRAQRRDGAKITHVTMVSEDSNMVGQHGVDTIVDGKTPDGHPYTWKKRRE